MKRLIPAVVILILVVLICIDSVQRVEKICSTTIDKIENCTQAVASNNFEDAKNISTQLKKDWQKNKIVLSVYVNHSLLDNLTLYIDEIHLYAKPGVEEHFLGACQNSITILRQIIHEEQFKISSFY